MASSLADRLRAAFGTSLQKGESAPLLPNNGGFPDVSPNGSPPAWGDIPGQELHTETGPCLVHEERYPLDHQHGGVALTDCLALPPLALGLLVKQPTLGAIDLREAVFLDTETTGLAGGTGTTAFLVGIGYFAPQQLETHFVIRQFFMRDFVEERALLLALAEALAPFRHVVTFNGKSFDLPLLETRFVLARLGPRWRPELHFDLLHPARRLWRDRLESCSLGSLEASILDHDRGPDVPSWLIPGIYAEYLRQGKTAPLRRVFSHNRQDLLSLVALVAQVGRRLAEPLTSDLGPGELLAVARLYDELGLREQSCRLLEAASQLAVPPLRQQIELALALAHRRSGRRDEAQAIWRRLASGSTTLLALIEQAKYEEHQRRRPAAALDLVEQALTVLELREARDGPRRWQAERTALERRLGRLLRKRGQPVAEQPGCQGL
jgi:uncharacterized protein YprB with RNaseH-like and TPR domain